MNIPFRPYAAAFLCAFIFFTPILSFAEKTEALSEKDGKSAEKDELPKDTPNTPSPRFFPDTAVESSSASFSNGALRRHFGTEGYFFVNNDYGSALRCTEDVLVRKKFDAERRLIQKMLWKPASAQPVSISTYAYRADSPFPQSAVITDNEHSLVIHETYEKRGLPVRRDTYAVITESVSEPQKLTKNGEPPPKDAVRTDKKLTVSETMSYDGKKRITEHVSVYTGEHPRSEKIEYRYGKGAYNADEFHYVDGVKIKEKVYSALTDWRESVFFAENIKVVTVYKNETAVSETFYENGEKKRERFL